jgi:hypothetical protein
MTKTIRKVMIVVAVLITSCQVDENLKSGPLTSHTTMRRSAPANAAGCPAKLAHRRANPRRSSDARASELDPYSDADL